VREARAVIGSLRGGQERFADLAYPELVARPLDTVERLYERYGWKLEAAARDRMQSCLRQRPRNRFGTHRYSLEQFDLDGAEIDRAFDGFAGYCV